MLHVHTPATVSGAPLARLLARLAGRPALPPTHSAAARLGEWLDWQRAVSLSRALDDDPAASDQAANPDGPGAAGAETRGVAKAADGRIAADCARTRAALEVAIGDDDRDWTLPLHPRGSEDASGAAAGAAAVQRHCQGLQRDLQAASGRLRGELRERLARRAGGAARLAAADAVMEGLLAPREHALLVPVVPALVAHFEQLHARHAAQGPRPPAADRAWRASFRSGARQVLLAELDLRFQPIEALLAVLRSPRPDA